MATIATTTAFFLLKKSVVKAERSLRVDAAVRATGLPALTKDRVVCAIERNTNDHKLVPNLAASVATALASLGPSHPALALVDERLTGEGTGLSLGLSNPLLAWILLGVSALIWSLYFSYTSTLPQGDDESGLSL